MSERVALVTGSTSGIGAAIARRLTRDGYRVALHGRRPAEAGEAMAAELSGASYHRADLGDVAHAGELIRAVVARHGRLDVLVNNAGEAARIPHADLQAATPEVWRRMMDVNLIAPWMLIAEAEQALRRSANGGRPASVVVQCLIVAVTLAMALEQLAIAQGIVIAAFAVSFGGIVLAFALAFGLGGADLARRMLETRLVGLPGSASPAAPPAASDGPATRSDWPHV